MNTRIWEVFFFFDQKYIYFGWPCSEYLKYMNTPIWEVVSILGKISYLTCPNTSNTWIRVFGRYSLFWSKYIYFGWPCSEYLKYMNMCIWEVVSILEKIFLFNMSKYLKYMNTRIWKVFFILIKNIFILVDHVLNTSNTWIRVFGRYSLF